jgi:hypothetical protein
LITSRPSRDLAVGSQSGVDFKRRQRIATSTVVSAPASRQQFPPPERGPRLVSLRNCGAAMSMEPDRDPTEFQQFGIVGVLLVAGVVAGIFYALARFFPR